MTYGFNEDKSKAEVYTKTEADSANVASIKNTIKFGYGQKSIGTNISAGGGYNAYFDTTLPVSAQVIGFPAIIINGDSRLALHSIHTSGGANQRITVEIGNPSSASVYLAGVDIEYMYIDEYDES